MAQVTTLLTRAALIKLGYREEDIKILFYGGKKQNHRRKT